MYSPSLCACMCMVKRAVGCSRSNCTVGSCQQSREASGQGSAVRLHGRGAHWCWLSGDLTVVDAGMFRVRLDQLLFAVCLPCSAINCLNRTLPVCMYVLVEGCVAFFCYPDSAMAGSSIRPLAVLPSPHAGKTLLCWGKGTFNMCAVVQTPITTG